jgi:hypothetical protein
LYYDISCDSEDEYPPSQYEIRIRKGHTIHYSHKLTLEENSISFRFTREHHGMTVECYDRIHHEEWIKRGNAPLTTRPLTVRFIERAHTTPRSYHLTVYSNDSPLMLRCSDYLVWAGDIFFYWYYVPHRGMTKYGNEMMVR